MIREMLAAAMCVAVLGACSSTPASTPASSTDADAVTPSAAASTQASGLPLVDPDSIQACGQLDALMDEYLGTTTETNFEEFADRLRDEVLPGSPESLAPLVEELSRTARRQPDETEIPKLVSAMQAVYAYCGFDGATG